MDTMSNLPDEIICHTVSFLSAKEAAFTAVLSKRFLSLYNIIHILEFDDCVENQWSLTDFLDRVLALPASSRIKKFSLKCHKPVKPAQYAHINRCLCDVLKRGVLDLELVINVKKPYSLPFEVFTCKTIIKLNLECDWGSGLVVNVLPEDASLPVLETLVLQYVRFKDRYGCAFEKLLSACHVLKELIIDGVEFKCWKWSGNISSPTLQSLTIHSGYVLGSGFTGITLDTPSLTYLNWSGLVPDEYPIVNLDSLVKAELDLTLTVDHLSSRFLDDRDIFTSNPTNLIKGLRNVHIMNFTSLDTFEAFYYFREAIPVFKNLFHLTITPSDEAICLKFLPFLLKKTPNLETLVIDGPLHYDEHEPESVCKCLSGYSFLLSCPLKFLQITKYKGTTGEVEQLKHFLEKLPCLKSVKLHAREIPYDWESWKWSRVVSSPTLEKLIINRAEYDGFDESDLSSITFDTPSLIALEIKKLFLDEYSSINLESLVEVYLDLELTVDEDDHITSDPTNLIQRLRNVEILDLLSTDTREMFDHFREEIPVFERLHRLTFKSDEDVCWRFLPFLLQKTPNLKTLVIEVLEFSRYDGDIEKLEVLEFSR